MIALPAYDLEAARRAFPICQKLVYLNHASISPIPLPAYHALHGVAAALVEDPQALFMSPSGDPLDSLYGIFLREVQHYLNAVHLHEVVSVSSTSAGMNAVAQAIRWQPGDNIVFCDQEFPSNAYPWMVLERRGVEIRLAPADAGGLSLEALDRLVDTRTRLVTVSAVQFLSGHRADLAALGAYCRARNILFAVDAIQAAGHMSIDVQAMQIDILAAGGQKSLMAPPGQGFLYVREAVAEQMQPNTVGPNAVRNWERWLDYDLTPERGAWRFLMGTFNAAGMAALIESLRFLRGLGLAHIDAWTRHLTQLAIDELTPRGYVPITPTNPAHQGPIASFRVGDPADCKAADARADALVNHLKAHGIRLMKHWDAHGIPHLRISTHCYNTEDEVRRVGAVLEEYDA